MDDQDIDMTITSADFQYVRAALARRAAISLTDDKEYLVINRLLPILRRHQIGSLQRLVMRLRMASDDRLWNEIVDALTTNETSFFRDEAPFQVLLKTILPAVLASADTTGRNVNIWSAGCSSGQEAYSLAMLVWESAPQHSDRLRIVGSDVSASMLQRAEQGRYTPLEFSRGLSESRRRRFFSQVDGSWQVSDRLKRMVRWEKFSLADSWPRLPQFDLVLMRNVMVYFDQQTRNEILTRVHRVMRPGGILLLGSAESMMLSDHSFEPVNAGGAIYYVASGAK